MVFLVNWLNNYQYTITDNYNAVWKNSDGVWFRSLVKVRYYGDKDDINFEDLEGRRHYLHRLIEKIISTGSLFNETIIKNF